MFQEVTGRLGSQTKQARRMGSYISIPLPSRAFYAVPMVAMTKVTSIVFFFLAALCPVVSNATPLPSLQEIIAKTLAHDDAQQQLLQSMQYDQTANIDQLDGHDKVTRHEVLHMIVRPGGNPPTQIISFSGDNIPSDPDQAEAQAQGRDVESNKQTFTLGALVNRFTITLVGEDLLAGQPTYEIAFAPKPDQPYHDDTEKVVNQLQGHMWISARTYNVLRTEASVARPVSVAWFLASVPKLNFHYSTSDTDVGFAASQVLITLQVNALFVGFHERQIIDMTNFIPRLPAGVTAAKAPGEATGARP